MVVPLLYIDTNIYMDHFDGRVDRLRPLGEFAFQLLRRSLGCEFRIVISSLVLEELFYNSYEEPIKELLPDFDAKGKVVRAVITQEDIEKARKSVVNEKHSLTTHCMQLLPRD